MKRLDLPPIATRSKRDLVWQRLRDAIVHGVLAPGDRIIEADVARQLQTSLAPVREALQRLEQEGFVVSFRHHGTYVTERSLTEMREAYEMRGLLESYAARLAAGQAATVDFSAVQQAAERMLAAADADEQATFIERDIDFHEHICRLAGHQTLLRVWSSLVAPFQAQTAIIVQHHHRNLHQIAASHLAILEAIRSGDEGVAAQHAHDHIIQAWARLEQFFTVYETHKNEKGGGPLTAERSRKQT